MCRMIGVVSRRPLEAGPYIGALSRQAQHGQLAPHGDGYGLALLRDGHWLHIREQCPIWDGALEGLAAVPATVMLLHARLASPGMPINLTKLHPFCQPGAPPGVMFCHNGTIRNHAALRTNLGADAIDTEKYFDIFMRRYALEPDLGKALEDAAAEIWSGGCDPTSLNALVSGGRELVTYKGPVLPENIGYHTLFLHEEPEASVISTEPFHTSEFTHSQWTAIDGIYRKSC